MSEEEDVDSRQDRWEQNVLKSVLAKMGYDLSERVLHTLEWVRCQKVLVTDPGKEKEVDQLRVDVIEEEDVDSRQDRWEQNVLKSVL